MDGGGHSIPPLCTVDYKASEYIKAYKRTVWVTHERNLPQRE